MNSVDYLLENKFSLMKIDEKLKVKRLGADKSMDIIVEQVEKRLKT